MQKNNLPAVVISALLSALLVLAGMGYSDITDDINKLDERKAEKDVVRVELENIHKSLEDIKGLIKAQGK